MKPTINLIHQATDVTEDRQLDYLEAMNIPVWVLREQPEQALFERADAQEKVSEPVPAETLNLQQDAADSPAIVPEETISREGTTAEVALQTPGLKLGPGAGGVMLVCAKDSDSASKMASDISRALGKMPVWAWPDSDPQAVSAGDAVNENLFTCVAVFGEALGHLLFGNNIPAALGSARLVQLPAMSELAGSASARRDLWAVLCRSGMIVS